MNSFSPIQHIIFIKLKDARDAAINHQINLGERYLRNHPGQLMFKSSVIAHNVKRHKQVSYLKNELDFDVAFFMVFVDKAAHDAYQTSERHVDHFIPESKDNWKTIRVFDSLIVE